MRILSVLAFAFAAAALALSIDSRIDPPRYFRGPIYARAFYASPMPAAVNWGDGTQVWDDDFRPGPASVKPIRPVWHGGHR